MENIEDTGKIAEEYISQVKAIGGHEYKGIMCLPDMKVEVIQWMEKDLQFAEGDVVVVCYPCAGIQWLQESLWLMKHPEQIGSEEKKTELSTRVYFLDRAHRDVTPKEFMEADQPPRLSKTHMPVEYLTKHIEEGKAKFIFWSLDPRKCLAKFHHHLGFLGPKWLGLPPCPWPVFWKMFEEKKLFEGDYFDYTKGFSPYLDKPNVKFMQFEEASKDPVGTLKQLADFCGFKHSDDILAKIAGSQPMDKTADHKAKFSEEQLKQFDDMYKEKMAGTRFEGMY